MRKILIIAAHPDDDILGCGGFIAKNRQLIRFRVVFVAEGSSCRFAQAELGSRTVQEAIAARTESGRAALAILGVSEVVFWDLPCGRLDQQPILDLNKRIEAELISFKPDLVMTHSPDDVNNDHRVVHRSVQMATRPGGLYGAGEILLFEVLSSSEWNLARPFAPRHFEKLSIEHLNMKWKALAAYESETREPPHPRSFSGLQALARFRGLQAGVEYAEAFIVERKVVG